MLIWRQSLEIQYFISKIASKCMHSLKNVTALASATGEKRHPREEGAKPLPPPPPPPPPRLHRTGGEAPCSMEGRKTRREENVFKGVENLPALLYTIV